MRKALDGLTACRIDNKLRLKEVKNLEDLIKFKVKTVADINVLATNADPDQIKAAVDPLLLNNLKAPGKLKEKAIDLSAE